MFGIGTDETVDVDTDTGRLESVLSFGYGCTVLFFSFSKATATAIVITSSTPSTLRKTSSIGYEMQDSVQSSGEVFGDFYARGYPHGSGSTKPRLRPMKKAPLLDLGSAIPHLPYFPT